MAKRRPNGDGLVRKREDGRWEGRIVVGHKEDGKRCRPSHGVGGEGELPSGGDEKYQHRRHRTSGGEAVNAAGNAQIVGFFCDILYGDADDDEG